MSGAYAPDGSKYVTIVGTQTSGSGTYAPDGSRRVTVAS